MSSNNFAFTAPINQPGQTTLTVSEVWAGLLMKIKNAELFIPEAIKSTEVISEEINSQGAPVTTRSVVFNENDRKVTEVVTAYEPTCVEFLQPESGSRISNVVSVGAGGELYLTYFFEWRHPGASAEEMAAFAEKEKKMSKGAVEGTISVLHTLAEEGFFIKG